jgi:hypothetical protein
MNSKINTVLLVVIALLLLCLIGMQMHGPYRKERRDFQKETQEWSEYRNDQLGFSFTYPKEYGTVKDDYITNQDGSKQFIGTFSENEFTFGTPTTDELSDAETDTYAFDVGIALSQEKFNAKNSKNSSYLLSSQDGKIHAVFLLSQKPGYKFSSLEFYGHDNEVNKRIIDSVITY